jgi:integrase
MATSLTFKQISKTLNPGRYFDDRTGLHLLVKKNGRKYWVRRFTYNGRRHDKGLGVFPQVSLKAARKAAMEARVMLDQGISHLQEVQRPQLAVEPKLTAVIGTRLTGQEVDHRGSGEPAHVDGTTFEEFALAWIKERSPEWKNQKHCAQWSSTLSNYAFPVIGMKQIGDIDTHDIRDILQPIWTTKTTTASRLRGRIERILSAATVLKLRTGPNPAIWRGHLDTIFSNPSKVARVKHHDALPYGELPRFVETLQGRYAVAARALEFTILTAARTGEVIGAKHAEIRDKIWLIPAERMKAEREHRVPLGPRALAILDEANSLNPDCEYLFSKKGRPLSNMAMLMLLKRMRVKATVHGFRSSFRDWVSEETLHSGELAEMALAHTVSNKVEAAYRRGDLLLARRALMLDWEDYCLGCAQEAIKQDTD